MSKTAPGKFVFTAQGLDRVGHTGSASAGLLRVTNTSTSTLPVGVARLTEKLGTFASRFPQAKLYVSTCPHEAGYHLTNKLDKVCHGFKWNPDLDPEQQGGLDPEYRKECNAIVSSLRSLYSCFKQEALWPMRTINAYGEHWKKYVPWIATYWLSDRLRRKFLIEFLNGPFPYPETCKRVAEGEIAPREIPPTHGRPQDKIKTKTKTVKQEIDGEIVKVKTKVVTHLPSSFTGLPNTFGNSPKVDRNVHFFVSKKNAPAPTPAPTMSAPALSNVIGAYHQNKAYEMRNTVRETAYENSFYGAKVELESEAPRLDLDGMLAELKAQREAKRALHNTPTLHIEEE